MRVMLVVSMSLLAACGGRMARTGDDAGTVEGEYASRNLGFTLRRNLTVTDAVTGRVLPLLYREPAGAGPFPVVVWSHGGGFLQNGHEQSSEWGSVFAKHGYLVIHIAHVPPTTATSMALCTRGNVPANECVAMSNDDDSTGLLALAKTGDVVAVLDALSTLSAQNVDAGGPAMDLSKVAVAGWSAGSRAPVVTHGATIRPTPSAPVFSLASTRAIAAIALSPTGPPVGGFFDTGGMNSWSAMRGPVLMMTGQNDAKPSQPLLTGPVRRLAFEKQPADGSRWLLYSTLPVGVGGHDSFNLGDASSSDVRLRKLSRALESAARAFLDAHVKNDAAARAWLDSDSARVLADEAEWVKR